MNSPELHYFSPEQGNFFIRLLLAHILADFLFQTNAMVERKRWFSKEMALHIGIVFVTTLIFSCSVKLALVIAVSHWLIDSAKESVLKNHEAKKFMLFVADQALHLLVLVAAWIIYYSICIQTGKNFLGLFSDYRISLYLLSYAIVILPVGYFLGFALQNLISTGNTDTENLERGGKLIGQFERIIILTFVLLNQYEAIGFLITGKSIIRFAQRDEKLKSEYVLAGTMMSYAISILIGVLTNWLIAL